MTDEAVLAWVDKWLKKRTPGSNVLAIVLWTTATVDAINCDPDNPIQVLVENLDGSGPPESFSQASRITLTR